MCKERGEAMPELGNRERWYAVQTRSNLEKTVTNELSIKGIENYCPAFQEVHQWADRKKSIERPVFPGYVFARILDTGPTRLAVKQTHGAVRILGTADNIEPVPDREIDSIQQMLKKGSACFAHPFVKAGTVVRVRRGALRGLEGKLVRVKNQVRLVLSIELLSSSVATEVDASDVEIVQLKVSR
jgi:transcription antitermination factor NusG